MNIIELIRVKLLLKQADELVAAYPFKSRCEPPSQKPARKSKPQ